MGDNRPLSREGLVIFTLFLVGLAMLGLVAAHKFDLGPFAPEATPTPETSRRQTPTPSASVTLIDFGRLTVPVPGLRIEEPAGALIIYVTSTDYFAAITELDLVARTIIESGDAWIYYFDTQRDGTIWLIIRCDPADMDLPARERSCQTAQMQPGQVPIRYLYEHGFVSSQ